MKRKIIIPNDFDNYEKCPLCKENRCDILHPWAFHDMLDEMIILVYMECHPLQTAFAIPPDNSTH